jgi:hypothetical protein
MCAILCEPNFLMLGENERKSARRRGRGGEMMENKSEKE